MPVTDQLMSFVLLTAIVVIRTALSQGKLIKGKGSVGL